MTKPQMTDEELQRLINRRDVDAVERAMVRGQLDEIRAKAQASRPELTAGLRAAAEERRREHDTRDVWPPALH